MTDERQWEERLEGGNLAGAVRVGGTVRRPAGPWSGAVQALLAHLASRGFRGAPRPMGIDDDGRDVVGYIPGETVGSRKPWPSWVYRDETLDQVADWLRTYHAAVADFEPPPDAAWRGGDPSTPGSVIGHNDAAPYNALWRDDRLVAFIDWEFAGPTTTASELAFVAMSWVPLHATSVVTSEGFTDLASRPRRLRRLLDRYGWTGGGADFVPLVQERALRLAGGIRVSAAAGDPAFLRLLEDGAAEALERAAAELDGFHV